MICARPNYTLQPTFGAAAAATAASAASSPNAPEGGFKP